MLISPKRITYFQILSGHVIAVRLKLLCVKIVLNLTNIKEIRQENSNGFPTPQPIQPSKRPVFPNSLTSFRLT